MTTPTHSHKAWTDKGGHVTGVGGPAQSSAGVRADQPPGCLEPGGGVLGAAVSEGVNLPRLLATLALAIAGAFLLVGERKGEHLPSESRIKKCSNT